MNKPAPTGPARDGSLPPVFALGFRPFYLGAGCFALIAMLLWLASYLGVLAPANAMSGLTWHKHEMLFGFAPAVMAGFLLTAVRSWTGQQTATGVGLAALVLLWVCGRLLVITGPGTVAAVVDSAFLPALGTAIAIPIWRSRNTRNYKVIAIVAALAALNAVFHLSELGILAPLFQEVAFRTALDVVALLIAVIGGRVIPAFTANAVPGAEPVQVRAVEFVAFGSLVMITLVDLSIAWVCAEHDPRAYRGEKLRAGGSLTAMVGHQQEFVRRQALGDQAPLDRRGDVAAEQNAALSGGEADDAGAVVAEIGQRGGRVQNPELQPGPLPVKRGVARRKARDPGNVGVVHGFRIAFPQGRQPAGMVEVAVADDDLVGRLFP